MVFCCGYLLWYFVVVICCGYLLCLFVAVMKQHSYLLYYSNGHRLHHTCVKKKGLSHNSMLYDRGRKTHECDIDVGTFGPKHSYCCV